jgi:diguanylate cyclase (GGDEF)-like protein/PAS domain S-box-containing protein
LQDKSTLGRFESRRVTWKRALGTLRTRLLLPFFLVSLLLSVAIGALIWNVLRDQHRTQVQADVDRMASSAARGATNLANTLTQLANKSSTHIALNAAGGSDRAEVERALREAIAADGAIQRAAFIPFAGESIVVRSEKEATALTAPPEKFSSKLAASSAWLNLSAQGERSDNASAEFVALRHRVDGGDGRALGIVELALPAQAMLTRNLLARNLSEPVTAKDATLVLSFDSGAVASTATTRVAGMAREAKPVALMPGWSVVANAPERSTASALKSALTAALISALPLALLFFTLVNPASNAIRDINRLSRATERFRVGGSLKYLPLRRQDEIGRVARAIAAMSKQANVMVNTERSRASSLDATAPVSDEVLQMQKAALAKSMAQLRQFAAVVEAAHEGIVILDRKFRIEYVNPAFANDFRMPASSLKGLRIADLFHPDTKHSIEQFEPVLDLGVVVRETVRCKRSDNVELYAELTASPVRDEQGTITGVVLVERDATATVMSSELMSRQLLIDPLTEVWRRSALITDMERRSARPDRQTFSVLFIDLDGFKAINDRFGHEAGDTVLRAVGAIMKSQVREHDVAARYGGDEFVVVVDDDAKESNARRVAQRIVAAIPTVTGLRYPDIRFGASIGIACFPRDADTPADVIRCADHAMYAAKRAGGGRVVSWVDVKVKPSWNSAPPSAEVLTLRRRG